MSLFFETQDQFQACLLEKENQFIEKIVGTKKVSKKTRLDIYRNAYQARLIEALQTTFPVLYQYLGSEQFSELCAAYIDACPSTFKSIRWYGDQLANFLLKNTYYKKFPYLSELALFEWHLAEAFDAADSAVLTIEEMARISPEDWESICFTIQPAFSYFEFRWNILAIWQALQDEKTPDNPAKLKQKTPCILWRREFTPQFIELTEIESVAINEIVQGHTFGEMCIKLSDYFSEEETGIQAAFFLKKWISLGFITSVWSE